MDAIRDNNFTPKQIRGIDLVVKSMSKKYPYVKGWKFDEEYDRWPTTLYIDIFVNWKEYGEVNGYRFRNYYEKNYDNTSSLLKSPAPYVFFDLDEFNKEEREIFINKGYEDTKKFKTTLMSLYEKLPDEFLIKYEYSLLTGQEIINTVGLQVDEYLDYRLM